MENWLDVKIMFFFSPSAMTNFLKGYCIVTFAVIQPASSLTPAKIADLMIRAFETGIFH